MKAASVLFTILVNDVGKLRTRAEKAQKSGNNSMTDLKDKKDLYEISAKKEAAHKYRFKMLTDHG